MPAMAGRISNRVGMTALCSLLRILLCFEFVPPPNLLFFMFAFVLPRQPPFFAGYELPSSIFLSDIWSVTLAFFVGHFEKMSDCLTSPTNFDSTATAPKQGYFPGGKLVRDIGKYCKSLKHFIYLTYV